MAGVFFALLAHDDGFAAAEPLRTADDALLLIHTERDGIGRFADRVCTKPWAADLDGDGQLDLVAGNMVGHFAFFRGRAGGGFESPSRFLTGVDGERLEVGRHSDPVLVDWDGDGDLDLVSGSDAGEISLFTNAGTRRAPRFGEPEKLFPDLHVAPNGLDQPLLPRGASLDRPGHHVRVAVHDLDGDGALDIVLTDRTEVYVPVEGLAFDDCEARITEWAREMKAISETMPKLPSDGEIDGELEARIDAYNERVRAHEAKRQRLVSSRVVAGVWVIRGRQAGAAREER